MSKRNDEDEDEDGDGTNMRTMTTKALPLKNFA